MGTLIRNGIATTMSSPLVTAAQWLDAGAIAAGMGGGLLKLPADAIREFHDSLIWGSHA
jgi:hypothetical protein